MMLITGGSGQLGTALRRFARDAAFPTRHEIDLGQPETVYRSVARYSPEAIINCAAYNAVDTAEEEPDVAARVNGHSVGELARYAADHAIPLITFSTDYVFDGNGDRPYVESDATGPVSAYGRSKLLGEQQALEYSGALVIRTSWVLSGTHPNFVATILRLVAERGSIRVVDDQRGCPTVVDDLAPAAMKALESGATGLLHMTNTGETTWFELARESVSLAGLDPSRVAPCDSSEYPTRAKRPAYSVLGSERAPALGIEALPPWRKSLVGVVAGLQRRGESSASQ